MDLHPYATATLFIHHACRPGCRGVRLELCASVRAASAASRVLRRAPHRPSNRARPNWWDCAFGMPRKTRQHAKLYSSRTCARPCVRVRVRVCAFVHTGRNECEEKHKDYLHTVCLANRKRWRWCIGMHFSAGFWRTNNLAQWMQSSRNRLLGFLDSLIIIILKHMFSMRNMYGCVFTILAKIRWNDGIVDENSLALAKRCHHASRCKL